MGQGAAGGNRLDLIRRLDLRLLDGAPAPRSDQRSARCYDLGLSAQLISTLTSTGSPLVLAGLLYGGSALALLAARAVRRQSNQESPVKRQDLGMLSLLTLIGGIAAPICLVSGLALLSAGSASLLLNLEAVFTMGIAILVGREHLSRKGVADCLGVSWVGH